MENISGMSLIFILVGGWIISRIHIWRIRKNHKNFLMELQENKAENDLNNAVYSLHKLFEIQEQNHLDYFSLIILTLMIIFKIIS